MALEAYKAELNAIGPIAVRIGQLNLRAPQHSTWGVVSCDVCQAQFAIGPNRHYGSRVPEADCIEELKRFLATDHQYSHPHRDGYELAG